MRYAVVCWFMGRRKNPDPGVIRQVRFSSEQYAGVVNAAKQLNLKPSAYIRIAALKASGQINIEEAKALARVISIRKVGTVPVEGAKVNPAAPPMTAPRTQ